MLLTVVGAVDFVSIFFGGVLLGSFLCSSRLKGSQLSASLGLSAGLAKTGLRFHVVAMGGWKKGGMGGGGGGATGGGGTIPVD